MVELAKKQSFKWAGLDRKGMRKSGVIQANDVKEAHTELKNIGIEVVTLTPKKGVSLSPKGKKIKVKEVQLFTRFLSTMLSAGLPIIQSLDIIAHDQKNVAMQSLLLSVKNEVSGGKTLAETFAQHPKQFNNLYCSLIKAGEKSGTLDKILNRLAVYLEKIETLKRKIRKALIYPIAILTVALLVSLVLLIFVVPRFQKMFESFGAKLPFFTQMIVNLSHFVTSYWWLILIVLIGGIIGLRKYIKKSEKARERIDKWKLKIPILGQVIQKAIIARYTRTLSTTLEAGMPVVESMRSMAPVMDNIIYTRAIFKISDDVTAGNTLSSSIAATGLFPNMVTQMVTVGETSGRLSDMLNKIADYYEEEVNSTVDNLSSLLEPFIMVLLGLIVGGFVIAMYLPIFKIGSLF